MTTILVVVFLLLAQQPPPLTPAVVKGPSPGSPSDVDLPRPHPREYPPVRRDARVRATPNQRGIFFTQDSQALGTVQSYTFGLLVDKSTTSTPLAATCAATELAQVFGCSGLFSPKKGTHDYRVQTTCTVCTPTMVQSQPFTFTY